MTYTVLSGTLNSSIPYHQLKSRYELTYLLHLLTSAILWYWQQVSPLLKHCIQYIKTKSTY